MSGLVDTTTPAGRVIDAEVVVIGSGAGGATTCRAPLGGGLRRADLEEGPWVEQDSVRPFSLEQMDRQYRAGGVTVALGLPSIAYTEGRCAGGGTEVNSGLYFRPPVDLIDRWRSDYQIKDLDPDEIAAIADEVERALDVGKVPGRKTPGSEILRAVPRARVAPQRDPAAG
jgi:choline dehydrogenase-like flavoprotein